MKPSPSGPTPRFPNHETTTNCSTWRDRGCPFRRVGYPCRSPFAMGTKRFPRLWCRRASPSGTSGPSFRTEGGRSRWSSPSWNGIVPPEACECLLIFVFGETRVDGRRRTGMIRHICGRLLISRLYIPSFATLPRVRVFVNVADFHLKITSQTPSPLPPNPLLTLYPVR